MRFISLDLSHPLDLAAISDLRELIFQLTGSKQKAENFSGKVLRSMLSGKQETHIAIATENKRSRKIMAMGTLIVYQTMTAKKAWVEDVVVHKLYRHKGLGHKITVMLEQKARDLGADYIDLTSGQERTEARRLYQSLGYKPRKSTLFRKNLLRVI